MESQSKELSKLGVRRGGGGGGVGRGIRRAEGRKVYK